jgi:hypothetical protein
MKIEILDLKKLGFKKIHVTKSESGGKSFDYYALEIGNDYEKLCLISDGNKNDTVMLFGYDSFVFTETTELILFIKILQNNYDKTKK